MAGIAFLGGPTVFAAIYFSSIPSIRSSHGIDPKSPFNIPFVVENDSVIFDMHRTKIMCSISFTASVGQFDNNSFSISSPSQTLKLRDKGYFFCNIGRFVSSDYPIVFKNAVRVTLKWSTNVLGYEIERELPADFTALRSGSGYYWMDGELLK